MFDHAIAEQARRQHGYVTLEQVRRCGGTKNHIRARVVAGRWKQAGRGLYRITGHPVSWESHLSGAVLAGGPGALASHRSAAVLWHLDGIRPGPAEISVPRHHRPQHLRDVRIHESTDLHLAAPTRRDHIPVTGIDRTILDLGAVVRLDRLETAIDCAVRRRLTDWVALYAVLVGHSRMGRDGCGSLRDVLDRRYGERVVPHSRFERLVESLLTNWGLPKPVRQHPVVGLFDYDIHVDLAYPGAMVGIELQSVAHHLNRESFETDRERLTRLRLAGWTMLEFTWRFYTERPQELINIVREATSGVIT